MADEFRPFVIDVKRRWTLLILPILAALYFLAVVLLNVLDYEVEGVTNDMLALAGAGLFLLVILIEIPFLLRRRAPKPKREKARPAAAPVAAGEPDTNGHVEDEYVLTAESQQGLTVLEYSAPAKSRNTNAVYTKTYVPVSQAHVLRVETGVADANDI